MDPPRTNDDDDHDNHHHYNNGNRPRTVEDVFLDYKARRAGIIRALTTDVQKFYNQCDPEKENLCLYGLPDGSWKVALPVDDVPSELPEPILGINFSRVGVRKNDWLSLVAVHSDSWLVSVAFYFGTRFGFDRADRKRLFILINRLPTVFEVVRGFGGYKKLANQRGSKSKSSSKGTSKGRQLKPPKDEDEIPNEQDEDDENEDTFWMASSENSCNYK